LVLCLAAVAMVVGLGACASVDSYSPPEGGSNGDLMIGPGAYTVKEDGKSVEYQADRGMLLDPENRSVPDSRLIALPVIRIRSLADNPEEPIFHLSGGPGTSNLSFTHLKGLIDTRDIVLVGYRGHSRRAWLRTHQSVEPELRHPSRPVLRMVVSRNSLALGDDFGEPARTLPLGARGGGPVDRE